MTDKETMKMALEFIERVNKDGWILADFEPQMYEAIAALKERLAQPEQEPVAWIHIMDNTEGIKANGKGIVSITQKRKHPFGKPGVDFSKSYPVTSTPLYTTPPQRTEQEPVANELTQLKEQIEMLKYKLWDCEEKSKPMQGQ